jgi:hypothetical protein
MGAVVLYRRNLNGSIYPSVHQTLRVTPAMEAGLTDHVWSLEELVGLLEQKAEVAA